MQITYPRVKLVVQILIDKGLAHQDAKDFLDKAFPLMMRTSWQELRPKLYRRYPNIVSAVERYCQVSEPETKAEQLKLI